AHYPGFKVWAGAQADIDRVVTIWRECFAASKGPYLFGKEPCMADAMYAPVVTRFLTYDVKLDPQCAAYCRTIMAMPLMQEWVAAAKTEPDEWEDLDVEFGADRDIRVAVPAMALDLLLRQGRRADEEGPVDIAVASGRIVEIADRIAADAPEERLDGRLVIAGFV